MDLASDVELDIFAEHASVASFLWCRRDAAVRDPLHDVASLADLDGRLEAHLDGLRFAGDVGWEICRDALEAAEAGEVFTASVLAVERLDLPGIAGILDAGGGAPALARGIVSALGWVSIEHLERILPGLLSGTCPPELTYLGIAGCAAHRRDPGGPLAQAVLSSDPRLQARALRATGELGRMDLLPDVRRELRAGDDGCRFWAAWSAALFGETAAATALWDFARCGGGYAEPACTMAMRRTDPAVGYGWLHALASSATGTRAALAGAGALGDPTLVPWVLECMDAPDLARLAGEAFTTITGIDLRQSKLAAKPPEGFHEGPTDDPADEDVSLPPDAGLPWPDAKAVRAHWSKRGGALRRGTRYLLGRPLELAWLEQVLRAGGQRARAAAAIELSIRGPRRPPFEVRAPGFAQRASLGL